MYPPLLWSQTSESGEMEWNACDMGQLSVGTVAFDSLIFKPHMEQRIEIQETDDKNMVPKARKSSCLSMNPMELETMSVVE